jgi:hypothetical protein
MSQSTIESSTAPIEVQTEEKQDETELTLQNAYLKDSRKFINQSNRDYFKISGLNLLYYRLDDGRYFPSNCLQDIIQQIRETKKFIIWEIGNMTVLIENKCLFLYKYESFWKLIDNHDILLIYDWKYFEELYEQLLSLIRHVRLQAIYFRFNSWTTKNLDDILKIVKSVARTEVYVNYYDGSLNKSGHLFMYPAIDLHTNFYKI